MLEQIAWSYYTDRPEEFTEMCVDEVHDDRQVAASKPPGRQRARSSIT
jgi:hypothetical protein